MSYSQNNEENIITEFFGSHKGKCLDIGAYDGLNLSNTRRLLELDWDGILVEPDPRSFCDLLKNCAQFKRVVFVNAAVTAQSAIRKVVLECSPGRAWATTINQDCVDHGMIHEPFPGRVLMQTMGIVELVGYFGSFDFVSLDAEWEDDAILRAFPPEAMQQCRLLCVECKNTPHRQELKDFTKSQGFAVHCETPENLIVAR